MQQPMQKVVQKIKTNKKTCKIVSNIVGLSGLVIPKYTGMETLF